MKPLNTAFISAQNHLLKRSPWALERLRGFSGRSVSMVTGSVAIRFSIDDQGYLTDVRSEEQPDVRIEIPLEHLPSLAGNGAESPRATFRLDGDADLAEAVGFVFRNLRWDPEEDLAHWVGDILAHRLGLSARWVHQTNARAWKGVRDNTVDYLTEEARVLVTKAESIDLMGPLVALRDDLARCEKRLERLSRTLQGPNVRASVRSN